MPRANPRTLRFIRALLTAGEAICADGVFRMAGTAGVTLLATEVVQLESDGVLAGNRHSCRPTAETRTWLRRQMLEEDPHARQHRCEAPRPDGGVRNLAESPLARLAAATEGGSPFLEPHQVEAGERVRRLVERALLRPRVTMSYDSTRTANSGGRGNASELGEMAADARRQLATLADLLPRECADVVFDVCGMEKGLQLIETERGWPRRSAKLVLRIALDQLARHFGLNSIARGKARAPTRSWLESGFRPSMAAEGSDDSDQGLGL